MNDSNLPTLEPHERLTAWWDTIVALTLESPQEDWDAMTTYLADDCVLYFGGMDARVSEGIGAVVADLKKTLGYWKMVERRVLAQGLDAEGTTVFASMNNRLTILGEPIHYPETEVVSFNQAGKIVRYELYCDPSPIKAVFERKSATQGK